MIPRIIHYCWVGGNPLPESAKKCIKSWKKYCPDYEIIEWNESNYDFTSVPYMKEAYEAKKWGFVPDYARLDIIYRYGGIYLDTDVEIVRSFDPLLELQGFAGFQDESLVALGLGFGAEAGNPVIRALMNAYETLHFINASGECNSTPSPRINTAVLAEGFGLIPNGGRQELEGMSVFPSEYFCPKSFDDGVLRKTDNTYSIHHFDASWFSDEKKDILHAGWKRKQRRARKLRRRKLIGGFIRKLIGDDKWERIKEKILKRR
ncbi:MAG: glycosyl transferase [Clostridia bacterium]|nr:glycosyl transferase [Clostridia bacterium]